MFRDSSQAILNRVIAVATLVLLTTGSAWSAGHKVLYNFTPHNTPPSSGLVVDTKGNAYGTTSVGPSGRYNFGTVYQLSPTSGYHVLFGFRLTGKDGKAPQGNLAIDSAGNLYGTTIYGGPNTSQCNGAGCGVVYKLSPPSNGVGLWTQTILYSFCSQANCTDGANPQAGVILDSSGNLYGTTEVGGISSQCCGTVFELSPTQSGWTESVISNLIGIGASTPESGLIFDAVGNLYGTTAHGGEGGAGTVFELSPSGGGWTGSILYSFQSFTGSVDGCDPLAGVIFDAAGNLFGTTSTGGLYSGGCFGNFGTVFELMPDGNAGWTETAIYNFGGGNDGSDPTAGLAIDSSGNLYGTTFYGGSSQDFGTIFELIPGAGGQWTERVFRLAGDNTGYWPSAPVILNSAGKVFGTTTQGGRNANYGGVVFEITP
jgi:uncharacterized repeat protein (TIGR03803 family)